MTADGLATLAGGRLGGDFPAFYGAGELVADDPAALADPAVQRSVIGRYLPEAEYLLFPYPFPLSLPYALLAALPYRAAYTVHVLVLAGALGLSVRGLVASLPELRDHAGLAAAGAFAFVPAFLAIAGGQNAPVVLAVLVGGFLLAGRARPVAAGALLAVLWFKPQMLVPVLGLLLVGGHWRVVAPAVVGGLGWYGAGVPWWGWDWPARWLTGVVAATDAANVATNTARSVSPVELTRGLTGDVAGGIVLVLLAAATVALWRWADDWPARLAVAAVGLLATAPHALFYELTLLLAPFAFLAVRQGRAALPGILVLAATASVSGAVLRPLGALVVLATGAWLAAVLAGRGGPASAAYSASKRSSASLSRHTSPRGSNRKWVKSFRNSRSTRLGPARFFSRDITTQSRNVSARTGS